MGTWGHRNLENDMALDELVERSGALIESLWARAKRKQSREYDEYDYTTLFVELEIAFALDAKGLLMAPKLPSPDEVDYLRAEYVEDWEAYYQGSGAETAHIKARKRCIVSTFNKFRKICKKQEEDSME